MTLRNGSSLSWRRSHSLWIVCIRSCQDKIKSMKIVVHEIFGEELMILPAVAFKNFKSPVPPGQGRTVLHQLQVTARSTLGALALNTGGLLIDHGCLRILDSPGEASGPPPLMTVAFDVLRGHFAIDGGGLGVEPGQVCYWAPDTLEWSSLGFGHSIFVEWALTEEGPASFYEDLRWEGWRDEVKGVAPSQGIAVYPPLFSAEAYPLVNASRQAVPFNDVFAFNKDMADQLAPPLDDSTSGLP